MDVMLRRPLQDYIYKLNRRLTEFEEDLKVVFNRHATNKNWSTRIRFKVPRMEVADFLTLVNIFWNGKDMRVSGGVPLLLGTIDEEVLRREILDLIKFLRALPDVKVPLVPKKINAWLLRDIPLAKVPDVDTASDEKL